MTDGNSSEDSVGGRALVVVVCLGVFGAMIFGLARGQHKSSSAGQKSSGVEALIAALTAEQRSTSVGRVRAQCDGVAVDACGCAVAAFREALDASLTDTAAALLSDARAVCSLPLKGEEAEVLVRQGSKGGEAAAKAALVQNANDPYANYAAAQASWAAGDVVATQRFADAAIAGGRGAPAHLLVGLNALARNDVEGARGAFVRSLETEPNDATALYDLALCDHRLNHYNAARTEYLAVLRLKPQHLEARYNLVLLTSAAGFHDEAVHDLAEFRAIAPAGDPRVSTLEAALAAAPVLGAPTTVVTGAAPSASGVAAGAPSATVAPKPPGTSKAPAVPKAPGAPVGAASAAPKH